MSGPARLGSVAAVVAVALALVPAAHAQEPPPGPAPEPAPYEYKPKPAPAPAPEAPPPSPSAATERIDESSGGTEPPAGKRGPPAPAAEPFCISCVLIGVGAVVLIVAIPMAAKLDGAGRRRDRLKQWLHDQGGAGTDVGFVAGYGFAKADEDETKYGIATGVVAGVGGVILAIGIGWVAYEGGFTKGPKDPKSRSSVEVVPMASPEGGGAAVDVTF